MSGGSDESIGYATTEIGSEDGPDVPAHGTPAEPTLASGVLLAGRYRMVRFLARGGMGEVYEAEDTTLQMRVALKCIAADVAADAKMLEQLKREVLLARKVTHPNVCRLHDLGFHAGEGHGGTLAFLTMDLLTGETLASYVAHKKRLAPAEALPIVKQIAEALEAAHRVGVIHRDLKSRNVMLVRDRESGPTRAVVMDFGIATLIEGFEGEESEEGEERRGLGVDDARFAGTPAYMAPEQVSGGAVTPRTDVYALGVVMFEMVTGTLPFMADKALDLVAMRLTHPAPAPRERVPTLDRRWNDVIVRCLARDPGGRYARVVDVVAALEARAPKWGTATTLLAATLGIGAAMGVVAGAIALARPGRAAAAASVAPAHEEGTRRPTVAVLPLRNASRRADAAWLSTALGDMLATELAVGEAMRLVGEDRVVEARRDLDLAEDAGLDAGALARLRDRLGADYVVAGGFVVAGESSLRLDVALLDARTGEARARLAATGASGGLFDLVTRIGAGLRESLGVRAPSSAQSSEARAAMSASPDAARAYAEGLALLRAYDDEGARAALERATQADPSFALAHAALAVAWRGIGADARALEEAKRAFEGSHGLPREAQLAIEAKYRRTAREWDRAVEIDRTLFGFFPDNVDYGLDLASALSISGRAKEAFAVVDTLHALPPPDGQDPRIDCTEADVASKSSSFVRRLAAARRCEEGARALGASLLEASALKNEADALFGIGGVDEGERALERAGAIYDAVGDADGQLRLLLSTGDHYWKTGELERARPVLARAVALARSIGNQYKLGNALNLLGNATFLVGDDDGSRRLWEEARGVYESIGDREGVGHTTGNIAVAFEDQGELARAREGYVEARDRLRAAGSREGEYEQTWNLATVLLVMGDVASAKRAAAEARALVRGLELHENLGGMKQLEARIARQDGDTAAARKACDEAIAIFQPSRSETWIAETRTELARTMLDERRLADAAAVAATSAEALRAQGEKSAEGAARATLAEALAAMGKVAEAHRAVDAAEALRAPKIAVVLEIGLARAAVQLASGDRDGAMHALGEVQRRAEASGYVPHALEARARRAALLPREEGAAERGAIAREARARGLGRMLEIVR